MNKFEAIGRLTRDPELSTTTSGISICKFSLAVNRKYASGDTKADFFNFVAWKGTGENINKYCKKGSQVYVSGELQNRSYKSKDGTKKYIAEINVDYCEFLSSRTEVSQGSGQKAMKNVDDLPQSDDGDLPF